MLETLQEIDTQIFLFINGIHTQFSDQFMWLVSGKLTWAAMYATILYVLVRNYSWRKICVCILAVGLTVLLADQICSHGIRPFVQRLRPSNIDSPISSLVHIVNGKRGGSYGFPSCHAANTFAVATFFWLWFRNKAVITTLFVWAILNSVSRLFLGVHYPGDLLVGAIIGMLVGWGVYGLQLWASTHVLVNWINAIPRKLLIKWRENLICIGFSATLLMMLIIAIIK